MRPALAASEPKKLGAAKVTGASLFEKIGGVHISQSEGELVMRLPIEGTDERAAHYLLADPPGLAVNLPYALPRAGFHKSISPANEMIRSVWVRERLGGLHFRVFFEAKSESCTVKYMATELLVRCRF